MSQAPVFQALILGCGYVGKAVARQWRGDLTVTATTTTPEKVSELAAIAPRVEVIHSGDRDALQQVLANQQIVLVSVGAPNAQLYETTYLKTAEAVVSVLSPTVQQIIFTSSYAVYGDHQGAWVDETTPIRPGNANGEILAQTEQIFLSAANSERSVCIFRLGGIYGPGRELGKIFRRAAGTTRPGTGDDPANWIHLDDIVGAIEWARQQSLTGIYNLVSEPMPNRDLLNYVCQIHQLAPISWDPSQPSGKPYNAKVSNAKLRQTGYVFRYPTIQEAV